jgi:hypothetical protein
MLLLEKKSTNLKEKIKEKMGKKNIRKKNKIKLKF